jgi:hypothetical protein
VSMKDFDESTTSMCFLIGKCFDLLCDESSLLIGMTFSNYSLSMIVPSELKLIKLDSCRIEL